MRSDCFHLALAGALLFSTTLNSRCQSFTFSTLAGPLGGPGSSDGPGTQARFRVPQGVAVDNAGNLYVADSGNDTIRKITPGGLVSTIAGQPAVDGTSDGPAPQASFHNPCAVTVDAAGNVYVAEGDLGFLEDIGSYNHAVRRITPDGQVSTLTSQTVSLGTYSCAWSVYQMGIAVDAATNLYVGGLLYPGYTVARMAPSGTNWSVSTFAGQEGCYGWGTNDGPARLAMFLGVAGVATDRSNSVYVADTDNNTIRKITLEGTGSEQSWVVSTLAGQPGVAGTNDGPASQALFYFPAVVAVDSTGSVYVADTHNNTIRKITNGVVSTFAGQPGVKGTDDGQGSQALFNQPAGVAVDSQGNVYVADTGNSIIRKITPGGLVSTLAGLAAPLDTPGFANGFTNQARFALAQAVAVDRAGNAYVADDYTIRRVTPSGLVTTLAGQPGVHGTNNGSANQALFWNPVAVAADAKGNVYVADDTTIRKITNGVVSTLAGRPFVVGTNDGSATQALFSAPRGLAVDSTGNLYVTENYSDYSSFPFVYVYTVRKIATNGTVSTLAGRPGSYGWNDGPGNQASFDAPYALAVDASGNCYIADTWNNEIRKITPGGVVSTLTWQSGFSFSGPTSIAVDDATNLYVIDGAMAGLYGNPPDYAIHKLTPAGTNWIVSLLAGSPLVQGTADGPALQAQFTGPSGIALDSTGAIYLADYDRIRLGRPLPPSLGIILSAHSVTLPYSGSVNGYVLEASPQIGPGALWIPLTNGIAASSNSFDLPRNPATSSAFYRLHHQ